MKHKQKKIMEKKINKNKKKGKNCEEKRSAID